MQKPWIRWTVIVLVVLVAASLALSTIPSTRAAELVRRPPANAGADYQLGGSYAPAKGVTVVSRDRLSKPAPGRYNICYVNAYQTQPGSLSWWKSHHPRLLLRHDGKLVRDPGWPDEVLLDTRRARLAAVVGSWIKRCAADGFDAVEPDNLDSYQRSRGELSQADNLAFARLLAAKAHGSGLAIAQKNLAELTKTQKQRVGFDFAVVEDCQVYDECYRYRALYAGHVIEIEYADEGRATFDKACARRGAVWSIVYRDRDLRTPGQRGYVRAAC